MGQTVAVVLAGGRGTRVGAGRNKVLLEVAGRAVIDWSVRAFADHTAVARTILVGHADDLAELRALVADDRSITVIAGGEQRADSERCALDHLGADIRGGAISAVLLHDGARPCVSWALIAEAARIAADCGVLPALSAPPLAVATGEVLLPARGRLVRAQTPQGGPANWLLESYDAALREDFIGTDTASYLERAGYRVQVIDGEPTNLKVTYPQDLDTAAATLDARDH